MSEHQAFYFFALICNMPYILEIQQLLENNWSHNSFIEYFISKYNFYIYFFIIICYVKFIDTHDMFSFIYEKKNRKNK